MSSLLSHLVWLVGFPLSSTTSRNAAWGRPEWWMLTEAGPLEVQEENLDSEKDPCEPPHAPSDKRQNISIMLASVVFFLFPLWCFRFDINPELGCLHSILLIWKLFLNITSDSGYVIRDDIFDPASWSCLPPTEAPVVLALLTLPLH